jgi:cbb3-type cytochrome oxidase subunit 1
MFFLTGMLIMVFNTFMTIRQANRKVSSVVLNPAKATA